MVIYDVVVGVIISCHSNFRVIADAVGGVFFVAVVGGNDGGGGSVITLDAYVVIIIAN